MLLRAGRLDEAERAFERALRLEPGSPRVLSALGTLALHRDDLERAAARLRRGSA